MKSNSRFQLNSVMCTPPPAYTYSSEPFIPYIYIYPLSLLIVQDLTDRQTDREVHQTSALRRGPSCLARLQTRITSRCPATVSLQYWASFFSPLLTTSSILHDVHSYPAGVRVCFHKLSIVHFLSQNASCRMEKSGRV